jgi:hypothetical protein
VVNIGANAGRHSFRKNLPNPCHSEARQYRAKNLLVLRRWQKQIPRR